VRLTRGRSGRWFAKNGSDVCTWDGVARRGRAAENPGGAGRVSRSHAWCTPIRRALRRGPRAVSTYRYNDLGASTRRSPRTGDVAAIMVSPVPARRLPRPGDAGSRFLPGCVSGADRLAPSVWTTARRFPASLGGGRACRLQPDPPATRRRSATASDRRLPRPRALRSATRVFFTGSFWDQRVAMAAAIACLETRVDGAIAHMTRVGSHCGPASSSSGGASFEICYSGPPASRSYLRGDRAVRAEPVFAAAVRARALPPPAPQLFVSARSARPTSPRVLEVTGEASGRSCGERRMK